MVGKGGIEEARMEQIGSNVGVTSLNRLNISTPDQEASALPATHPLHQSRPDRINQATLMGAHREFVALVSMCAINISQPQSDTSSSNTTTSRCTLSICALPASRYQNFPPGKSQSHQNYEIADMPSSNAPPISASYSAAQPHLPIPRSQCRCVTK